MRRLNGIRIGWLAVLSTVLLLSGCQAGGGTSAKTIASESAEPTSAMVKATAAADIQTLPSAPSRMPLDIGGSFYPIQAGEAAVIEGDVPESEVDAAFFQDAGTAWLITRSGAGKLSLVRTASGGTEWHDMGEIPGDSGEALHFIDNEHGFAIVAASCASESSTGEERCQEKLLRTNDGGRHWDTVWESDQEAASTRSAELAFPGGGTNGYAVMQDGQFLLSRDAGSSWKPAVIGKGSFQSLHMSFINESTGWIVGTVRTEPGSETSLQVWKTADGGAHWRRQFERTGLGVGSGGIAFGNSSDGYFLLADTDAMTGSLMKTTDGGLHWSEAMPLKPARPSPMGIRLLSDDEGWIPLDVGAGPIDGGLLQFTKSGWESSVASGDGYWSFRDAVPTGGGTGWAVVDSPLRFRPTVLKTMDKGESWTQVWPSPHPTVDVVFLDDLNGYGIGRESDSGAFLKTSDGGKTWRSVSALGANGVRMFFADRLHGWVLATTAEGTHAQLLATTDGGETWRIVCPSLPDWTSTPAEAELAFANDSDGLLAWKDVDVLRTYRTTDGGSTWQTVANVPDDNEPQVLSIMDQREVLLTALKTTADKKQWMQLSRVDEGGSALQPLGKWDAGDLLEGAVYPSNRSGALLIDRFESDRFVRDLLVSSADGASWIDHALPSVPGLEWDEVQRFGANGESDWWMLMEGHLLRTKDAGLHWTVEY